ncbi:MAG: DUF975 family protein [Clostridiales bacterium]|nr:DUF975 family protein [Clostridiales bacterium]
MNYGFVNRAALKANSKDMMRRAIPAAWLIALVYQLVTDWVSTVISLVSPWMAEFSELYAQFYTASYGEDVNAIYQASAAILSWLRSTSGYLFLFVTIILALYTTVMSYGYTSYALGVVRGEQPGYGELFSRFYMAGKIILAAILEICYVFLWSLLLIIPGIIAAYRYRLVPYFLLDDPDISVMEAFRRSKATMRGRKWELFTLDLSFILWVMGASLLVDLVGFVFINSSDAVYTVATTAVSTLCYLFLLPYQELTYAQWYLAVRPAEQPAQPDGGDRQPPQW